VLDPGVDPAKLGAAGRDPDMGLAVAAGPIAEKRRTGGQRRASAPSAASTPAKTAALRIGRAACRIALRGFRTTGRVGVLDAIQPNIGDPPPESGAVAQIVVP